MSVPLIILGAGASGVSCARLASHEGRKGTVFSEQKPDDVVLEELKQLGFGWQTDFSSDVKGEVILSPGIPFEHPWVEALRKGGTVAVPEFEWAARRCTGVQIAVTGSLGKTSMVLLAAELLKDAGYRVTVSGNIGPPVSDIALQEPEADFHLLEVSSFQLEASVAYRPDRGLCLNLFPNHLDRHGDLATYAKAKARLFEFQTPEDLAVWPSDFPVKIFSAARRGMAEDVLLPELGNSAFASSALRKNLRGLFAVLQGIPGVDAFQQQEPLQNFSFPPHRMQTLEIPGAGRVVDDSKSTCFQATLAALEGISGDVQLVMGGIDKAEPPSVLQPLFRERNPEIYLFGHSAKKMQLAWKDSVDVCRTFDSLDHLLPVLWKARSHAQTLLFSPGCASFDQFSGYVARGQHFQKLVQQLAAQSPLSRTVVKETL